LRASSSSCTKGASENRTDFGEGATGALFDPRRDFLRKEEEEPIRGRSEAREKSLEREGSLGCVSVEDVVSVGVPRNWDARSSYCVFKLCSVSKRVRDALVIMSDVGLRVKVYAAYDVSPASCNRIRSFVTFSNPSRNDSRDREIWPSCEVGSRLRDMARCRSSSDSLL
jgi:hypothetical protein